MHLHGYLAMVEYLSISYTILQVENEYHNFAKRNLISQHCETLDYEVNSLLALMHYRCWVRRRAALQQGNLLVVVVMAACDNH